MLFRLDRGDSWVCLRSCQSLLYPTDCKDAPWQAFSVSAPSLSHCEHYPTSRTKLGCPTFQRPKMFRKQFDPDPIQISRTTSVLEFTPASCHSNVGEDSGAPVSHRGSSP